MTPGPLLPQSSPRNSLRRLSKHASAISCPRPSESKFRTPAATSVLDSAPAKLLSPEKDLCMGQQIENYVKVSSRQTQQTELNWTGFLIQG
jgi:hypothetical protein